MTENYVFGEAHEPNAGETDESFLDLDELETAVQLNQEIEESLVENKTYPSASPVYKSSPAPALSPPSPIKKTYAPVAKPASPKPKTPVKPASLEPNESPKPEADELDLMGLIGKDADSETGADLTFLDFGDDIFEEVEEVKPPSPPLVPKKKTNIVKKKAKPTYSSSSGSSSSSSGSGSSSSGSSSSGSSSGSSSSSESDSEPEKNPKKKKAPVPTAEITEEVIFNIFLILSKSNTIYFYRISLVQIMILFTVS